MPKPAKHKIRHVVRRVYETPWAILPEKLEEITELIDLRAAGETFTPEEIAARIGRGGGGGSAESTGQVAVLNLFGVIAQRMNAMEEISGGTSTEMFGKAFDEAVANENISAIVINVDSPGGTVTGVPELAAKIYAARGSKRIIAVANSLMASAAYWVASAADEIVGQPSSYSGSLGVLTVHTDRTEADAQDGIKHTVIRSSAHKAERNPYEPLSEEALKHTQERVNKIHADFIGAVATHRGASVETVQRDYGQGRVLLADEALAVGMIDRVETLEQVLSELGVGAGSTSQQSARHRPAYQTKVSKEAMDPKILTALVRRGLCNVDASEEAANAALQAFFVARGETQPEGVDAIVKALSATSANSQSELPPGDASGGAQPGGGSSQPAANEPAAPAQPQAATAMSTDDLLASINLTALSAEDRLELFAQLRPQLATLNHSDIVKKINEKAHAESQPAGAGRIDTGAQSLDKFFAASRDAILARNYAGNTPEEIYDFRSGEMVAYKPQGRPNRNLQSPLRLAEACLLQAGIPQAQVAQLSPEQIARIACGSDLSNFGIFAASDGPAYNVSGMFSNILLDATNVMLRRSYNEANTTFQVWAKQGASISDFKDVHKVIAGELDDPKMVPEDGEFEETTHTDGKEKYALDVWGHIFSITWQAIVNDQLGAFSEIPAKQGRAMRRKQNKLVYGVLVDNAALQNDGVALFSDATHNNLTTGTATPTVATLNTMHKKMAEQTGLNAQATLNIQPRYIMAAPALRGSILELLGSTANPASSGNSGVTNIWQNALEPVIDAQLGAAAGGSDTAWHLAADPMDVDTVEYAYLQGLESPAVERMEAFKSLAVRFRIYQAFATKAIDFRGLQKHNGV